MQCRAVESSKIGAKKYVYLPESMNLEQSLDDVAHRFTVFYRYIHQICQDLSARLPPQQAKLASTEDEGLQKIARTIA